MLWKHAHIEGLNASEKENREKTKNTHHAAARCCHSTTVLLKQEMEYI